MANKVDFQLNLQGLNELMKSPAMQSHIQQAADAVKANAESMASDKKAEYRADVVTGNYIAIGRVHSENTEAMRENYANNTLVKALGSVGLSMTKGGKA